MVFAPVLRRLFLFTSLLCSASLFAQDTRPQPIPPMEEASAQRSAPQVAYANGKLQITAHHAELGDILDAVRVHTGAVISAPLTVTSQPVSIKLGPATLLDVMTDLLEAAECNYIVVGSAAHPATLRISVFPKPSEAEVVEFAAEAAPTPKTAGNTPDSSNVTVTEPANDAELGSVVAAPKETGTAATGEEADRTTGVQQAGTGKDSNKPSPGAAKMQHPEQSSVAPK